MPQNPSSRSTTGHSARMGRPTTQPLPISRNRRVIVLLHPLFIAVLQIHDILVWIRIRLLYDRRIRIHTSDLWIRIRNTVLVS